MSESTRRGDAAVGRSVAVSAGYVILGRITSRLLGIVTSVVFARLLTPADFGVVGLAAMVLGTLDMLTQSSIGAALIRFSELERRHYDTAWTLVALRGAIVAGLMIATADLQAHIFGDERIAAVIWVLALAYFVQSLPSIRLVDFQRNLQYGRLYLPGLAGRLISFAVSMSVCVIYRDYWALVVGNLASTVFGLCYGYWLAPYRPKLSLECWREFFRFSKWLSVNNFFTMLDNQLPTYVIGSHDGVAAVGRFQMANQVAALPASEIAAPIRGPAYSGLARVTHDHSALRRQLINQIGVLVLIVVPLSLGIWVSAPWIVRVILGKQWLDAIPLLEFCAIGTFLDAVAHHVQMVFIVVERQRRYALMNGALITARAILVLLLGLYGGVNWVAGSIAGTAALSLIVSVWLVMPAVGSSSREFLLAVWRPGISAALMCAAVLTARVLWPVHDDIDVASAQLAVVVILGGIIYISSVAVLWLAAGRPAGAERHVLDICGEFLRHRLLRFVTGRTRSGGGKSAGGTATLNDGQ